MDNSSEIKLNWEEIKQKLKLKFGMLTESDLLYSDGKQDEMLSRLQTKLGRTKAEVKILISELH